MSLGIPDFPRVRVLLREDGGGEVTIQGLSHLVHAHDLAEARTFALGLVTMRAALVLGRPVRVTAQDPHGTWPLIVHPNGRVHAPDSPPPPRPAQGHVPLVTLTVDHEPRTASGHSILVGRDPHPSPGEGVDALLAIEDTTRLLSKTHARIDVDHDGDVTLTDRHSTNGSRIELAGVSRPATPGQAMIVPLGAVIRVGDRILTVTRAHR